MKTKPLPKLIAKALKRVRKDLRNHPERLPFNPTHPGMNEPYLADD